MMYVLGIVRFSASMFAVASGFLDWPIWTLALLIPPHAIASTLFSRALLADVHWRDGPAFERGAWLRGLALAFVKLGIGYAAGLWLAALFAP